MYGRNLVSFLTFHDIYIVQRGQFLSLAHEVVTLVTVAGCVCHIHNVWIKTQNPAEWRPHEKWWPVWSPPLSDPFCRELAVFALIVAQEQLVLQWDPAETQTLSQVRFYESKASVTDCAQGCQNPPHIQGGSTQSRSHFLLSIHLLLPMKSFTLTHSNFLQPAVSLPWSFCRPTSIKTF